VKAAGTSCAPDDMITVRGNQPPRQIAISRQAERIILLVDPRGGSALIRVNGGVFQEVFPDPEARVVADIVDLVFNQIRKKNSG
jgi:hypothetical protein